jgi:pSer/pThr/pTyr-binding forkhead associated (FHA) protein
MFKLVIQDDEGKTTVVPLIRDEITIGRKEGNTIRLTERNVSRRHARILRNNGEVHIEDLGSYNGIRVNNARIAERVSLRVSDQVQIGDYKLYLKAEGIEQADEARTMPIERVDSTIPTEAMSSVAPGGTAPHAIPQTPPPQMIGNPNRTLVAIADTDPTGRAIGPATAAAVAALTAPGGGYGKLVALSSNFAGKEFELSRPQMIVGRTDENDIVINHRSISRNHAKLVREPETSRYTISDLQSSNGVRVNGQDYGKVELRRGDVVDLGHVRLRFVEAGEDFVFARDAVITDVPEAGGRRGMVVALLAAIVVLVAGVVIYTMHGSSDKPSEGSAVSGSANGVATTTDAAEPLVATPDRPSAEATVDAMAPASAIAKPNDENTQFRKCTDLYLHKEWQALDDCATELGALGLHDKAKEFHAKAKAETDNEAKADKVKQAIKEGNLKEAQAVLRTIGEDSFYFKAVHDPFVAQETKAADDARRKALGFASLHDCASLKRFVAQQVAASTPAVATAAAAVKCAPPASAEPPGPKPLPGPGSATVAPPVAATPPKNGCDAINVDDLMTQAAAQYTAGYAKGALAQVVKALGCKQDGRMYRFAVMYACTAHDLASAKQYFAKAPQAFQPNLEQKCQQEGLNVRGPGSP